MSADDRNDLPPSPVPDAMHLPEDAVERAHRAHLGLARSLDRMRAIPGDVLASIEPDQAEQWIRCEWMRRG